MSNIFNKVSPFHKTYSILKQESIRLQELNLSLFYISWGLFILSPLYRHDLIYSDNFIILNLIGGIHLWGFIILFIGLFRWFALISDNRPLRRFLALLGFIIWIFISISIYLCGRSSSEWFTYAFISFLSFIVYQKQPSPLFDKYHRFKRPKYLR